MKNYKSVNQKIINISKQYYNVVDKNVFLNAQNKKINSNINKIILENKKKWNKIEMHESHSSKPFILNSQNS